MKCYAVGEELGGPEYFQEKSLKGKDNGSHFGGFSRSGTSFSTVNAEITQETIDFFVSDAEGDPDCPSEGFSSIDEAISALHDGNVSILLHKFFFLFFPSFLFLQSSLVEQRLMFFLLIYQRNQWFIPINEYSVANRYQQAV